MIFKFQAWGIDQNGIIWTDFTFSGLPLALPGFSDDGSWFGSRNLDLGLALTNGWIKVLQGTD